MKSTKRWSLAELHKMRDERSGCVQLTKNKKVRCLVGLYRSLEAGIEKDPSTPWAVVCEGPPGESHSGVLLVEEFNTARHLFRRPWEWCPDCQKKLRDPGGLEGFAGR